MSNLEVFRNHLSEHRGLEAFQELAKMIDEENPECIKADLEWSIWANSLDGEECNSIHRICESWIESTGTEYELQKKFNKIFSGAM